ncbi:MAG: MBL fold metallo-hydrolase [Patescibacteria group bacterium]|nr:MBL fold metallo-hydrolase [Patescibacteria group bacterium]
MIITYQGGEFFKVQFGNTTLAFNPISKDSKLKTSRFGADIALITTNHPDFNGIDQVSHGEAKPFVISGPGEYETKGVFIRGFLSKSVEERINTIYLVSLEGMNICFLGALKDINLINSTKEALEEIDILFTPVNNEILSPSESYKFAVSLEPKIIIPMYYDDASLKIFVKESGEKSEPLDKLTIKKKDLDGKEGDVVILLANQ